MTIPVAPLAQSRVSQISQDGCSSCKTSRAIAHGGGSRRPRRSSMPSHAMLVIGIAEIAVTLYSLTSLLSRDSTVRGDVRACSGAHHGAGCGPRLRGVMLPDREHFDESHCNRRSSVKWPLPIRLVPL